MTLNPSRPGGSSRPRHLPLFRAVKNLLWRWALGKYLPSKTRTCLPGHSAGSGLAVAMRLLAAGKHAPGIGETRAGYFHSEI